MVKKLGQKGIALLLVLTSIAILTVATVEFSYNTNVNSSLVHNELERLQAKYLAQSAFSFMLLELKLDKTLRGIIQQNNLGQYLGAAANLPLCQQFPLSTGLIRTVFLGESLTGDSDQDEDVQKFVSLAQEQGAGEFLSFDGDFDGQCNDEAVKINLNHFYSMDPDKSVSVGLNEYDDYKSYIVNTLKAERYKKLFEDSEVVVEEVVRNLADWVDENTQINESGGRSAGAESSLYQQEIQYKNKNAPLTTYQEMYQVAGIQDKWFTPIQNLFTIFGDGKVNVCLADEGLVEALVVRYVTSVPDIPPVRLADEEVMQRLIASVQEACSQGVSGDALVKAVGDKLWEAVSLDDSGATAAVKTKADKVIKRMITGVGRYYRLKLTGQVRNTMVRIDAVIDVNDKNPEKWPILYWKLY